MSSDRDVTRIVRSWLDEGVTALPDRVLDTVLDRVPSTPQRRAWWPARRFPPMHTARMAMAAVAIVAIAFLGIRYLLPAGNVGGTPTPTAIPTPVPTPVPVLNGQSTLEGQYQVNGLPVGLTVALPAGGNWWTDTDWVVIGPNGNQSPGGMAIRFYTVGNVYKNPISTADGFLTPSLGPTVDDLVRAILTHPGWAVTGPTPVSVDGYAGQQVRLTLPSDNARAYYLFTNGRGGDVFGFAPAQVFDISIVNVAGQRVVIEAYHYPGTSQADLAAQQHVLASIQLSPRP